MTDPWVANLIAAAALLFSGASLILSIRTKRSQDRLITRQIEAHDREAAAAVTANVSVRIEKEPGWAGSSTQWKVVVRNNGPATARNVRFEFTTPQQLVPQSELSSKLPISVLSPGDEVRLVASATMGMPSKYQILVEWHDAVRHSETRELIR